MNIHQHITDQIIKSLDTAGEFHLPWHRSTNSITRPTNIATKARYKGINILSLWATADELNYQTGIWGTYKQWSSAGAQVRKGEKATYIVFYKSTTFTDASTGDTRQVPMARASAVFAAEQVDNYSPPAPPPQPDPITPIKHAEAFLAQTGATIHHGGNRAYYSPSTDHIQLPPQAEFESIESYYSTALHELTHWTSHPLRVDRQLGKRFGDQAYAMEELIAELGAAFLCADVNISATPRPDHAQYLNSWLKVLKGDSKAIFTAASAASKAVDYLEALQGQLQCAA